MYILSLTKAEKEREKRNDNIEDQGPHKDNSMSLSCGPLERKIRESKEAIKEEEKKRKRIKKKERSLTSLIRERSLTSLITRMRDTATC